MRARIIVIVGHTVSPARSPSRSPSSGRWVRTSTPASRAVRVAQTVGACATVRRPCVRAAAHTAATLAGDRVGRVTSAAFSTKTLR